MKFADYLSEEWRPSLGCTEPAAIAYAASLAASHQRGEVRLMRLVCDARTYKNCHSVGIPNSERRTGLLWTLAIGAHLPDHSLGLRCFEQTDARALHAAGRLLEQHGIHVEVDPLKTALFIDVTVVMAGAMGLPQECCDEALALACLLTSATTWHLGTLSAICGAAIAGGIGMAAGVTHMHGGCPGQLGLAIGTMVGNLAGMICDGAKIGCAMKTMTGVDAAFRAANLALLGMGIPVSDGIVGGDAETSLANLGRLAQHGMATVDAEILSIMQDKLKKPLDRHQENGGEW